MQQTKEANLQEPRLAGIRDVPLRCDESRGGLPKSWWLHSQDVRAPSRSIDV